LLHYDLDRTILLEKFLVVLEIHENKSC